MPTSTDPNAVPKAIVDAKGDLIVATANDTVARLAVGTDGQVLTADSTQPTGLKWAAVPTSGGGGGATPQAVLVIQPFGEPATVGTTGAVKTWFDYSKITSASLRVTGAPVGGPVTANIRRNASTIATLTMAAGSTTEQTVAPSAVYTAGDLLDVNFAAVNGATGIVLQLMLTPTVAPPPPPGFPSIAAVIDYWDADDLGTGGSPVSAWTGRKGKVLSTSNPPTVTANAINGHKAVTFNGTSNWLANGTVAVTGANFECYVVLVHAGGSGNPCAVSLDKAGVGSDWDTNSGGELVTFWGDTVGAYRNNSNGGVIAWPAARSTPGLLHSYWAGTTHTIEEGATTNSATAGWGSFDASRLNVGAYAGHDANFFGGKIAALVIATGLTSSERASLRDYFAARYGL